MFSPAIGDFSIPQGCQVNWIAEDLFITGNALFNIDAFDLISNGGGSNSRCNPLRNFLAQLNLFFIRPQKLFRHVAALGASIDLGRDYGRRAALLDRLEEFVEGIVELLTRGLIDASDGVRGGRKIRCPRREQTIPDEAV